MRLLSIDPGLHGLGCGYFEEGELQAGFYLPAPGRSPYPRGPEGWRTVALLLAPLGLEPDVMVAETMRVYARTPGRRAVDPDDLLQLQGIVGCIAMLYPRSEVVGYLPEVWKGQVPQDVYARRVVDYLAGRGWGERLVLPGRSAGKDRDHDVLHGVGVGLHHLGYVVTGKTVRYA